MASDRIIMVQPLNFKLLFLQQPFFSANDHHYRSLFVKDGLIEKLSAHFPLNIFYSIKSLSRWNCFNVVKLQIQTQTNLKQHLHILQSLKTNFH